MVKETTKESIIQCALKLFSEKGYSAVSMRDLAESVGISVSTIYHYYESKQELFRDIVLRAAEVTAGGRETFLRVLAGTPRVEKAPFTAAGARFVKGYLHDERIGLLLKILESERFHDAAADALWKKMLFLDPISHETTVFRMLASRGEIGDADPERLAFEYHAIVALGYFSGDTDGMEKALGDFYDRVFSAPGKEQA